jgi:dienelactone hydrolase
MLALIAAAAVQIAPLDASAFAYDAAAPLGIAQLASSSSNGVTTRQITFRAPSGTIRVELIAPQRGGSHPGVLFVHWLGDPKTTNHTEFEPDATALAKRGATSLLVDAMWAAPNWFDVRTTATDYQASIDQVVTLRRALDVLVAQSGVDSKRLAYVGHDFGAMYGAVLAGVDSRPRWYVLMAGTTSFADWYLLGKRPPDVAAYRAQMAPLDPLPYLQQSRAAGYLFQFSGRDQYVPIERADAFFSAAPLPRAMYVYDAGHALAVPAARNDRLGWLGERLF